MIIPPYLQKGDTIGIVSTARKVTPEEIFQAVEKFNEWGLNVVFGENLFNEYRQFAGTDEQRLLDFQKMLDEPKVKAVILARGGYGTVKIIDKIDFFSFAKNPKWILGYSDATVLHSHINKIFEIATMHCPMAFNFNAESATIEAIESIRKSLFGESLVYAFGPHFLNRNGMSEGILTGGNLSIIYSLTGTSSQIDTRGKILFLEDLDEYLYHVDRMMMNLKRSGLLSGLKGLMVGGMTEMKDNKIPFGLTAEEIILDAVKEYDFPVCFNFPAGHILNNRTLQLGRTVQLEINAYGSKLWSDGV
jgi:muramoyltetrapeptide carboxypeptidase